MSGPKLSQAEIERRRQAELERQRQERLRRLREANKVYRAAVDKLAQSKAQIMDWLSSDAFLRMEKDEPALANRLRKKIIDDLSIIKEVNITDFQSEENILQSARLTSQQSAPFIQKIQQYIKKEEDREGRVISYDKKMQSAQDWQNILSVIQSGQPIANVITSFAFDGDRLQLQQQLRNLADFVGQATGHSDKNYVSFCSKSKVLLLRMSQDPGLSNKKEEVRCSIERILNTRQNLLDQMQSKIDLYDEYCSLTAVLGDSPDPFNAFADMKSLNDEVNRLKKIYQKKDEMDFIADQINQVMINLGYQFVNSVALQRDNGTEYDYSLYQADEEAGISIYTDESGAVMMQMTTFGEGAVTPEDEEESYQRQLDFCMAHPEIVDALAQRGVILKQRHYAAPDRKYVRKMKVTKSATRTKVDRRKRRRAKKKMRALQL